MQYIIPKGSIKIINNNRGKLVEFSFFPFDSKALMINFIIRTRKYNCYQ